jgi:hypothetical protein
MARRYFIGLFKLGEKLNIVKKIKPVTRYTEEFVEVQEDTK